MDEDLKTALIRLGSNYPELRVHIRPILNADPPSLPSETRDVKVQPSGAEAVRVDEQQTRTRFEILMNKANKGEKNG